MRKVNLYGVTESAVFNPLHIVRGIMHTDVSNLISTTRVWAGSIPEIRAVFLFGSRAREDAKPHSDWDICIVVDGNAGSPWYGIWHAKAAKWKNSFCKANGLKESEVQFCSPTSDKVRSGLEESARLLFLRDFDQVLKVKV